MVDTVESKAKLKAVVSPDW